MVILPALGEFYRSYPDVTIELGIGNRHADLIAEGIDCAIRAGEATEQFMVARRIGEFRFTTCATTRLPSRTWHASNPAGNARIAHHRHVDGAAGRLALSASAIATPRPSWPCSTSLLGESTRTRTSLAGLAAWASSRHRLCGAARARERSAGAGCSMRAPREPFPCTSSMRPIDSSAPR
jgi:DNA-binding transcriptional LysR family regulator